MDSLLRSFNGDLHTKEAFKQYMSDFIAQEAVRILYTRGDATHIADAHDLINKAFEQLDVDYGITEQPTKPFNTAR